MKAPTIAVFLVLLIVGCDDRTERAMQRNEAGHTSDLAARSIEVSGKPNFDPAATNLCSLVLQLPKAVFSRGESIPFALVFRNVGSATITLDGHIPLHRAAGPAPPALTISKGGNRFLKTMGDGLVTDVLCKQKITIEPNSEVILMQGDLMSLKGIVHVRGVDWKSTILGEHMKPGRYCIYARWETRPTKYSMEIRDVVFEINK